MIWNSRECSLRRKRPNEANARICTGLFLLIISIMTTITTMMVCARRRRSLWRKKNHRLSSGAKGLKSKNSFLLGLIAGFRAQLHAQKIENEERGLIYIGSSLVTEYFHRRYPRQRRISPQRYYATRDYQNGYDQGKKLRLKSGVSHQTGSEVRRLDAPKN